MLKRQTVVVAAPGACLVVLAPAGPAARAWRVGRNDGAFTASDSLKARSRAGQYSIIGTPLSGLALSPWHGIFAPATCPVEYTHGCETAIFLFRTASLSEFLDPLYLLSP
jgi:hypothetical protein